MLGRTCVLDRIKKLLALLVLLAAGSALADVPGPIPIPGGGGEGGPGGASSTEELLIELGCECDPEVLGFKCPKLPAFADYTWTHPGLPAFALRAATLAQNLHNEGFTDFVMAIQGLADSREIKSEYYKYWEKEKENIGNCSRPGRSGLIADEDLAWLRSCTTRAEIENITGESHRVDLLNPKDYKQHEGKEGPEYMAAVIYILPEDFEACNE